jgi:hypothetical protein
MKKMKTLFLLTALFTAGCASLDIESKLKNIEVMPFEDLGFMLQVEEDPDEWISISPESWRKKWDFCEDEILRQAKEEKMDYESLKKCLAIAKSYKDNKGIALLPIMAYWGKYRGKQCWYIKCIWEMEDIRDEGMLHERYWIIESKTGKVIYYNTCG